MQRQNGDIFVTKDGSHSVHSGQYGVSYHSIHGAVQETQHVFIDAGYKEKLKEHPEFLSILEIGFGTGLNAFMTFLESQKHKTKVLYTTVEAYPITEEMARSLNYPEVLAVEKHKAAFYKMHTTPSEELVAFSSQFSFLKDISRFEEIHSLNLFDLIYFDAFAPNAQPSLWEQPMLSIMYRALRKNGILVTYCAKGQFKRDLKAVGFEIEAIPGPPGKREMTRARKK